MIKNEKKKSSYTLFYKYDDKNRKSN